MNPTFSPKKRPLPKFRQHCSNPLHQINLLDSKVLPTPCSFPGLIGRELAGILYRNEKIRRRNLWQKGVHVKEKRFLKALVGAGVALALVAMMLFPMGCSKLLPTVPHGAEETVLVAEGPGSVPQIKTSDENQLCSAKKSERIEPSGGLLHLQAKCFDVFFEVPSGALSQEARITAKATLTEYRDKNRFYKRLDLDFQPDGLVFSVPAKVKFKAQVLDAKGGQQLNLYWYNPSSRSWELEQEVTLKDGELEVEFKIYHFSRYAIS
jgi:hypothetical protein